MCDRGAVYSRRRDVTLSLADICLWRDLHKKVYFVDATPRQIGVMCAGYEPVSVPLPEELPIYLAEYDASLIAVLIAGSALVTVFVDNLGACINLDKITCLRQFLQTSCRLFQSRSFSVRFVSTWMSPADLPSRTPCGTTLRKAYQHVDM